MRNLKFTSGIFVLILAACGAANEAQNSMVDSAIDDGAKDQIKVYEIAKKNGAKMEACTQAMAIAALFLQAKNESSWKEWKAKEEQDCKAAGMPVS